MDTKFQNVEIKGNRLYITRDALMLRQETCISIQKDCKTQNDFTTWLITTGYIEAIKDLMACFEGEENNI